MLTYNLLVAIIHLQSLIVSFQWKMETCTHPSQFIIYNEWNVKFCLHLTKSRTSKSDKGTG